MSIALANSGDLQIELIQQRNDAPSIVHGVSRSGRERVAAACRTGRRLPVASTTVRSRSGDKVGHEGQIGGEQGRFALFDTQSHPAPHRNIDISGTKGAFFERISRPPSIGTAPGRFAKSAGADGRAALTAPPVAAIIAAGVRSAMAWSG